MVEVGSWRRTAVVARRRRGDTCKNENELILVVFFYERYGAFGSIFD